MISNALIILQLKFICLQKRVTITVKKVLKK